MNVFKEGDFKVKEVSKDSTQKGIIEALLFVSGEPLSLKALALYVDDSPKHLEKVLDRLIEDYQDKDRGIKLIRINGEYQLVTKNEYSDYIQKLLKKNKRQSLSQASLESLAIVAYKQPITRIDIDEIRGVKSDSAISRLMDKELIKEVGRLDVPGRPILYSTTEEFLRQFGVHDLKELPSLDLFAVEEELNEKVEIEFHEE
ncbi:SMC-Scp complex subunit ScpB [Clostridium vincentii]|nr:SMC-Scp complex subunit ScpB [Clostridium vincentii]